MPYRNALLPTPENMPDPALKRVKILVVDDLEEKHLVYRTILDELDQDIFCARSGEEALRLLLHHEFAVILLDVNMPEMDGIETAEMIRKRRKSSATPIIFLTAFSDDVHIEQGYASGAVDYLMTPVMPEILKAKVRVFIELSQMRQQAAKQAEERARRKAAEESERRKDAFLGMLAHELRNPLAPIRNAIDLLRQAPATPDVQHLRSIIDRQVTHMTRLVDDLLDSTRLAHGKILLQKEPCNLAEIITQTVEDYRTTFQEKGVSLNIDLPEEAFWTIGDDTRLVQMVGNLLHNAHKFTDAGGAVSITLTPDEGAAHARITVRDTGIGIDAATMPHIFDLFYQEEQDLDRTRGGLGLGLSLVRKLADMHGGSVNVESGGRGEGTTFTLQLPLRAAPADAATVVRLPRSRQSLRTLLIEDSMDAAETTRMLLEHEGHDAQTAATGPEGIEMARQFNPNIIICDIGLPGMDGYEVAREIRRDPQLRSAFLIALTGYGRDEDKRKAKEAGFDLHIVKPIDLQQLRQALAQRTEAVAATPAVRIAQAQEKRERSFRLILPPILAMCSSILIITFAYASARLDISLLWTIAGGGAVTAVIFALFHLHYKKTHERLAADNMAKTDFLRHFSHAIRTPLTTIGGVAEILESAQANLTPKQQQLVRSLGASTATLKTLINETLSPANTSAAKGTGRFTILQKTKNLMPSRKTKSNP